jgi:hypothetical protein
MFTIGRDVPVEPAPSASLLNYLICVYAGMGAKAYTAIEKIFMLRDLGAEQIWRHPPANWILAKSCLIRRCPRFVLCRTWMLSQLRILLHCGGAPGSSK